MLSDFFVEVGCHRNLQVAIHAVDSLRQLAMKFLERDELANYTFQNDFLKPFVVVMRQSKAVEIRELIIRQAVLTIAVLWDMCAHHRMDLVSVIGGASVQMCVPDGAGPRCQCEIGLEVHVHGFHHCRQ